MIAPPGMPPERPPSSRETFEQAIAMLREDRSRGFNIDIETDTMVFEDQKAEKAARVEFIGSVSNFLREAVPAAQLYPQIAPILVELLMFGVRGFKAGRQLEQVFEEATDQLTDAGPQQPKPDPKVEAEKARVLADKERLALDREDKQLRQKVDFEDVELRRNADLAFEERRLAIQAMSKPAPVPAPQVDPTAPTEREKFEFDKLNAERDFRLRLAQIEAKPAPAEPDPNAVPEREKFEYERTKADREHALKLAAQNKQVMSDAEEEMSAPGEGGKSPLAEMSQSIAGLAQAIVQGNQLLATAIAEGQASQGEQFAQLAALVAAPRNVDLKRDKSGRATGATSTVAGLQ